MKLILNLLIFVDINLSLFYVCTSMFSLKANAYITVLKFKIQDVRRSSKHPLQIVRRETCIRTFEHIAWPSLCISSVRREDSILNTEWPKPYSKKQWSIFNQAWLRWSKQASGWSRKLLPFSLSNWFLFALLLSAAAVSVCRLCDLYFPSLNVCWFDLRLKES